MEYIFDREMIDEDGFEEAVSERSGYIGLFFVSDVHFGVFGHSFLQ